MEKLTCKKCRRKFEENNMINGICKGCKKDSEEYKELIRYLCNGFKIDKPTGKMLKEIKNYKELGYSYLEIQMVVYYIVVIKKKPLRNYSLGLVGYYVMEAKEYYRKVNNLKNGIKNYEINKNYVEKKVNTKKKNNNFGLIDIGAIE